MQSNEQSDTHLSYPAPCILREATPPPPTQPRPVLRDRLYIGNLHPTVDEYTLLQAFSKFGKVSKMDFLFHKTGPMKGKPRGYAFIEYANQDEAAKALTGANNKLLRGRKLVVTYAQQAPLDQSMTHGGGGKQRRFGHDAGKPTTLSLLKSAGGSRTDATEDKIAKMEAKLKQLEHSSSVAGPSIPAHASLPAKPIGAMYAAAVAPATSQMSSNNVAKGKTPAAARVTAALPSLPLTQPTSASLARTSSSAASTSQLSHRKPSALAGVKIKKK